MKTLNIMEATCNFWQTNTAIAIRASMSYWRRKINAGDTSEHALLKFNHFSAKQEAYRNKKTVIEILVEPPKDEWKPAPLSWN